MRTHRPANFLSGFTLLEVLIALLVLALGVMGAAAMQLSALRARHQATLLAQATQMAFGLAERMRANPAQMRLADGANAYLGLNYDALADPHPAAPEPLCLGTGGACGSAQMALFDLYELKLLVSANLPAGRAVVCRDAALWSGGKLRWSCAGGAGAPLVVKIGWRGKNPDGTPHIDDDGQYAPAVALGLGATP